MAQEEHHMVSPSGSALMALGVVCFCFFAMLNGYVSGAAAILTPCIMIAAFIPQFVAAIFDCIEGNSLFGNLMMYFACFFMLGSGLTMLEYLCGILHLPVDPKILGWVWIILAAALWGWTPGALCKAPWSLRVGILCADVVLLLVALSHWGHDTLHSSMAHCNSWWDRCIQWSGSCSR